MSRFTVGILGGEDAVELVVHVDEADRGLYPVVCVVSRVALHEIGRSGLQAIFVEEPGDTRAGHAAPVVVVVVEHAGNHGNLRVACFFCATGTVSIGRIHCEANRIT